MSNTVATQYPPHRSQYDRMSNNNSSTMSDRSFQPFLSLLLHFHFCHCLPGKMPTQPTN